MNPIRDVQEAGPPHGGWPAGVAAALWRGDQLGARVGAVLSSGFEALDAQLPGGGWPCRGLSELLLPAPGTLEWRLLGPVLRQVCAARRPVVLVGPPHPPHPPGLRAEGIDERQLVWVQAETPAQRLWSVEQLVRSRACGALVAWLPQARAGQLRRLQVLAAAGERPVFLCRPAAAAREPSAAPLRLRVQGGPDWTLRVELLKRKGPPLETPLSLEAVPGGLRPLLTPRLRQFPWPAASSPSFRENDGHAVVRAAPVASRSRAMPH